MSKIPHDIITDIFRQLPVKSLIRFRSLSNSLCSLIDARDFVNLHLSHSLATKSHLSLILKDWNLFTVYLDSLDAAVDLSHPLPVGTEAVGSCKGLIALRNSERDLALYNISTRKVKRLPVVEIEPPNNCLRTGYVFYGFGYDGVSDDFKLVRMAQFAKKDDDDEDNHCEVFGCDFLVQVYSLRNDSWKRIKDFPCYLRFLHKPFYHVLHRRGYGVLASGALHWVLPERLELGIKSSVIAFDIEGEAFRLVPLPAYGDNALDFQVDVGVLEGSLCLMCNYRHVRVDVWVMKEYGVKDSWTKVFSVGRIKSISSYMFLKPLTYSKEGDKVLLEVNDEKLVWYDWNRRSAKSVKICGSPKSFGTEMYVESLIPLGDCGRDRDKKQGEDDEKRKTNRKKRDDFLSVGFKLKL